MVSVIITTAPAAPTMTVSVLMESELSDTSVAVDVGKSVLPSNVPVVVMFGIADALFAEGDMCFEVLDCDKEKVGEADGDTSVTAVVRNQCRRHSLWYR